MFALQSSQILTHMIYQRRLDWLQPNPTAKIMFSLSCFLSPLCHFWQSKPDNEIIELCFRNKNPQNENNTIIPSISRTCVCVCVCPLVPQALGFPYCKNGPYLPQHLPTYAREILGLLLLAHCWISWSSSCINPRRPVRLWWKQNPPVVFQQGLLKR